MGKKASCRRRGGVLERLECYKKFTRRAGSAGRAAGGPYAMRRPSWDSSLVGQNGIFVGWNSSPLGRNSSRVGQNNVLVGRNSSSVD